MFKKFLVTTILISSCLFTTSVFAEVGPLTAKYQEMIKNAGMFQIKCNDYTETDMMAMAGYVKKKRKPSATITVAKNSRDTYYEKTYIDYWKGMGSSAGLQKNDKLYRLDLKKKEGVLAPPPVENNNVGAYSVNGAAIMNNQLVGSLVPTALVFIIPDEMKNTSMKTDAYMYKYRKAYEEQVEDVLFQCEEYGIDVPQMKRIYKLYFKDGVLVKFAHGNRLSEVLSVDTTFDNSIFNVPKGFKIYAAQQGNMNDLLKTKTVVEHY